MGIPNRTLLRSPRRRKRSTLTDAPVMGRNSIGATVKIAMATTRSQATNRKKLLGVMLDCLSDCAGLKQCSF